MAISNSYVSSPEGNYGKSKSLVDIFNYFDWAMFNSFFYVYQRVPD